jgi:hypothetical protein
MSVRSKKLGQQNHKNTYNQGYFCDGKHQNAIPEVIYQKDTSWNSVPELLPDISITNTSPSPNKTWLTVCVQEPMCFKKIALPTT